jgi:hypothetical protein
VHSDQRLCPVLERTPAACRRQGHGAEGEPHATLLAEIDGLPAQSPTSSPPVRVARSCSNNAHSQRMSRVGLGLVRQPRAQPRPVAGHLGEEPGLAAPAQQMPDHRDGQQLGVAAGRCRTWAAGMSIASAAIASSMST